MFTQSFLFRLSIPIAEEVLNTFRTISLYCQIIINTVYRQVVHLEIAIGMRCILDNIFVLSHVNYKYEIRFRTDEII